MSDSPQSGPPAPDSLKPGSQTETVSILTDVALGALGIFVGSLSYYGVYGAGIGLYGAGFGAILSLLAFPGAIALFILLIFRIHRAPATRSTLRFGLAALMAIAIMISPFIKFQAGARTYMDGFCASVTHQDIEKLRAFSQQALQQYASNTLKLAPQPWNTLYGAPAIDGSAVPVEILRMWNDPIHYIAIEDFNHDGKPVILISWYLSGVIVGPPDYKTDFKAFDVRELEPGVYAFIREK